MSKIYLLSNHEYKDIENIKIFKIEFIPSNIDLTNYDALVFTSKNAIYSLNSFNNVWKNIPAYTIANKTANVVIKEEGEVSFIGKTGHGNDFAEELIPLLKNKKALYVRAVKVASNLVSILENHEINIDELITYKTVCNNSLNTKIEDNSIIIFTSPSSVKCFFKKYVWNDTLKAVVIGKTTAKDIPSYVNYIVSPKTSIEECIKVAKSLTI